MDSSDVTRPNVFFIDYYYLFILIQVTSLHECWTKWPQTGQGIDWATIFGNKPPCVETITRAHKAKIYKRRKKIKEEKLDRELEHVMLVL